MEDADEDGLDFWANSDGSGLVRFREIGASWLKSFNADFGTNIIHQFTVGGSQTSTEKENSRSWEIFPNPSTENILIEGFSEANCQIKILDNLGKKIIAFTTQGAGFISKRFDITKLKSGVYFVEINTENSKTIKKFIKN